MACYIETKAHIFRTQTEDDYLVLNYDDETLISLSKTAKSRVVWFTGKRIPPFGAFVLDGRIVFGTEDDHIDVCGADELLHPRPA